MKDVSPASMKPNQYSVSRVEKRSRRRSAAERDTTPTACCMQEPSRLDAGLMSACMAFMLVFMSDLHRSLEFS